MKNSKQAVKLIVVVMICLLRGLFVSDQEVDATDAQKPKDSPKPTLTDEELGELLQQVIILNQYRLYAEAEERCKLILAHKPNQPTVLEWLREIKAKRRQQEPTYELRHQLEEMIVPNFEVRDAEPKAVTKLLQRESQKLTPDKKPVNFVWLVPDRVKLPRVTLRLNKVPLLEVLRYLTKATGLRYRVDPHAVVIYKAKPQEAAPALPEPPDLHVRPE